MPMPKIFTDWCLKREWSTAPLSPSASSARCGWSGSMRSSDGMGIVDSNPSNCSRVLSSSTRAFLPCAVRIDVTRALRRLFAFGNASKTLSQMCPVPFIGYRKTALGPQAGASRFEMTLLSTSSNLMVATRSPTQIEFISTAGCAQTLALYGSMKVRLNASPKPASSHSLKLRGGGGLGAVAFRARSAMMPATSSSGSRHIFACTG
mmetsp:Transcript_58105/g.95954  ORF Transcript_58105/g.95954 Transcript_58105/m.95954 type:complete len:206 (-) Transcript_58105:525-1142(-)